MSPDLLNAAAGGRPADFRLHNARGVDDVFTGDAGRQGLKKLTTIFGRMMIEIKVDGDDTAALFREGRMSASYPWIERIRLDLEKGTGIS